MSDQQCDYSALCERSATVTLTTDTNNIMHMCNIHADDWLARARLAPPKSDRSMNELDAGI